MPGNDALRLEFTHTVLSSPKALQSQAQKSPHSCSRSEDATHSQELASAVYLCVRSLFNCGCGFRSIFGED